MSDSENSQSSENVCIYHGGCDDGFASAVIVHEALKGDVLLCYGRYNKPEEFLEIVEGKNVYFVDFSVKRDIMKQYAEKAGDITIIDHHETAKKELFELDKEFDNLDLVFDMSHSGAYLTWKYFFKSGPPELIKHIEDGDMWWFKKDLTEAVQMSLRSIKKTVPDWSELIFPTMYNEHEIISQLYARGYPMVQMKNEHVNLILEKVHLFYISNHETVACNCNYFYASTVANQLMKRYNVPFALCYFVTENCDVQLSFRSEKDRFNVADLAVKFGGGGHQAAAGCHISLTKFLECVETKKARNEAGRLKALERVKDAGP